MITKYDGIKGLVKCEDVFQAKMKALFKELFSINFGLVELFLGWEASFKSGDAAEMSTQQKVLVELAVKTCSNLRSLQLLLQFGYVNEAQILLRTLIEGWLVLLKLEAEPNRAKKWLKRQEKWRAEDIIENLLPEIKGMYDRLCKLVHASSKGIGEYKFPPFALRIEVPAPPGSPPPSFKDIGLPMPEGSLYPGYPIPIDIRYNSGPQSNYEAIEGTLIYSSYFASDFLIKIYEKFPSHKDKFEQWKKELDKVTGKARATRVKYDKYVKQMNKIAQEVKEGKV